MASAANSTLPLHTGPTSSSNKESSKKWMKRVLVLFFCGMLWNLFSYNNHSVTNLEKVESIPVDKTPPTSHPAAAPAPPLTDEEEINIKYCGTPKCRFLFPISIGEQESKAQQHFRNLIRLAERIGRIIVLPNVGGSRIGSCKDYPFDYYYSISALLQNSPKSRFIMQSDLIEWAGERKNSSSNKLPSTLWVDMDRSNGTEPAVFNASVNANSRHSKVWYCVSPFYEEDELENISVLNIHGSGKYWQSKESRARFADFYVRRMENLDVENLVVGYNFRFSIWEPLPPTIKYAEHLVERALATTEPMHPYVAIHWRMEGARPSNLPDCATRLVKRINDIKKTTGIENVYLATDYPLEGGRAHSTTFRHLTNGHHDAINILRKDLNFSSWLALTPQSSGGNATNTTTTTENDEGVDGDDASTPFEEPGVLGILDKLILMDAEWFVSSPPGCSRGPSSFTGQIVNQRQKFMDYQKKSEKLETIKEELKEVTQLDTDNEEDGEVDESDIDRALEVTQKLEFIEEEIMELEEEEEYMEEDSWMSLFKHKLWNVDEKW